jgi:hypothetical protein
MVKKYIPAHVIFVVGEVRRELIGIRVANFGSQVTVLIFGLGD